MADLSPAEYRALLRRDFCAFVERCFRHLNRQTKFFPNWHIDVMAAKLVAAGRGQTTRLILNVPPRHLKSLCASVALPAWLLGHDPTLQIICVSYGQDLADKLARDCRSIVSSAWYKALFPATRLSFEKQSVQEFVTTRGGFRLATSVGGILTGRGADLIIIDDPLKPEDALSDTQRRAVNEWYDNTLYTRLNSKAQGSIIIVMHRLHEDDLVGRVLAQESWQHISLPAIADQDEEYMIKTPYGTRRFTRRTGEVLHAEREPRETLAHIRSTIGEYNFAGQYQQAPAPLGGGIVKEAWFPRYSVNDLPTSFEQVVQSWDSANKVTELSDYSVCTTWGITQKRIYLISVFRKQLIFPDLKRAVREQARLHGATIVLIEDRASGTQLVQDLVSEGMSIVKACPSVSEKKMRLNAQTSAMENGFVYLPREAPWLAEFLHELTTFPHSKYADQVDSTSQALAWINAQPPESGWSAYVRRELACMKYKQGVSLDVIAKEHGSTPEEILR